MDEFNEFQAMQDVDEVLLKLSDEEVRKRVVTWAYAKHVGANVGPAASPANTLGGSTHSVSGGPSGAQGATEIPGIAMIGDDAKFSLTVRDLKANTTNDAAIRIALVSIYAYCLLTGESSASSKHVVKPALDHRRAYTGNTRAALARHPGLVRNGDALSLDYHARQDAERYIAEINDDSIEGTWRPSARRGTRK